MGRGKRKGGGKRFLHLAWLQNSYEEKEEELSTGTYSTVPLVLTYLLNGREEKGKKGLTLRQNLWKEGGGRNRGFSARRSLRLCTIEKGRKKGGGKLPLRDVQGKKGRKRRSPSSPSESPNVPNVNGEKKREKIRTTRSIHRFQRDRREERGKNSVTT